MVQDIIFNSKGVADR